MRFSTLFNIGLVGSVLLTPAMAQDAKTVQDQAVEALRARISELRTQSTPVDARAARSARQRAEVKERNEARDKYQAEKRAAFEKSQKGQIASSKTRTTADAATVTTNTVSPAYQSDLEKRARQLLQERSAQQPKPAAAVPLAHPSATPPQEPLSSDQLSVAQRALRQQYASPTANPAPTPIAVSKPSIVPALQNQVTTAPVAAQQPLSTEQLMIAQSALRQQYSPPSAGANPAKPVPALAAVRPSVSPTPSAGVAVTPAPPQPSLSAEQLAAAEKALHESGTKPALAPGELSAAQKALRDEYSKNTAPAIAPRTGDPAAELAARVVLHSTKTKQERLAELLNLYKADKITPGQYHQQRVKIVNEP